jgi:hypothetical protein
MIQKQSVANDRLNVLAPLLNGGTVEFWTEPMITDTTETPAGTLLVTVQLENPAFTPATIGKLHPVTTSAAAVAVAGVAFFTRWKASNGDVIMAGTVGELTDFKQEFNISSVNFTTSDMVNIHSSVFFV